MLLSNYSYINQLNGHNHSGVTNPFQWIRPHVMRNYYTYSDVGPNSEQIQRDNFPTGGYPPHVLVMSDKGGLLSATTSVIGVNGFSNLNLAGGVNVEGEVDGNGDLNGQLGALAFLISSLTSSGDLSGNINAAISIAANLAGSGDLIGALSALVEITADLNGDGDLSATLSSALYMTADLVGSGDIVGGIQALVQILSDITGTSTLTSAIIGNWNMAVDLSGSNTLLADINALAHILSDLISSGTIVLNNGAVPGSLSADITSASELSPENLAAAVWNSIAASFNDAGTMGNKLNNAASAGDPWGTALPGAYADGEAGKILSQIQVLIDELHKVRGLKLGSPVDISATNISVDGIEVNISTSGGTTTIERQ